MSIGGYPKEERWGERKEKAADQKGGETREPYPGVLESEQARGWK